MNPFAVWVVRRRIAIGVALFALGLGVSVVLAFVASTKTPIDASQSALLVVVAGLLNLGGAWAVSRPPGAPNLTASRTAVRHLAAIAAGAGELAELAEKAFDRRNPGKSREDIGELSWKLSEVKSRLVTNLEDWARAYPDLTENQPDDAKDGEPEKP